MTRCVTSLIIRKMQAVPPLTSQNGIIRKPTNSKCWRGRGGKGPLVHCDGNVNQCSHYGKQVADHLKQFCESCDASISTVNI